MSAAGAVAVSGEEGAPRRIKLSRARGWRKPAGAVVVARPSRWGNPFVISAERPAAAVVAEYERAILDRDAGVPSVEAIRSALRGKDLGCWCALDAPCHADVLLRIANSLDGRRHAE